MGGTGASRSFPWPTYTIIPTAAAEDAAPPADRERSVAMLQWLASQTGGRAIEADALVAGPAPPSHHLDACHALTYQPPPSDGPLLPAENLAQPRGVAGPPP